jgi:RimJ/RimL family protein N-acetyltransferase
MRTNELIEAAAYQLAHDYACAPGDFFADRGRVTAAKCLPGRRMFKKEADFFKMASLGGCVVASVSAKMMTFTEELLSLFEKDEPSRLFQPAQLYLINKKLGEFGMTIGVNSVFYLPKTPYKFAARSGFNIRVFDENEIRSSLYEHQGFANALMYQQQAAPRRDKVAVCAFNANNAVGMAGASSDSDRFWQIGIDVKPEYRGRGLAVDLVSALTREVFSMGAIPYYGTWAGNIASQNVALKCGYYPAWTEVVANAIG